MMNRTKIGQSQLSLPCVMVGGILLFQSLALAPAEGLAEPSGVSFKQYEIAIDSAQPQTVLTGFFLDGAVADVAVVSVGEDDRPRLRLYRLDQDQWVPALDSTLGAEVLFVDVVNLNGTDRLLTFEPGRINWFDPESSSERVLVQITSNHSESRSGPVLHMDVSRDVNGDSREDLVIPDSEGFWVFIQREGGAFAKPLKLGVSTETRRFAEMSLAAASDGYRFNPWLYSRIHEIDHNQDGRVDLVFWNDDHFEVHYQDESGLFAPTAESFTTEVAFDSEGLASFVLDASGDKWTALYALGDQNGDGIPDLVALSPKGASRRSTWSRSPSLIIFGPRYEVHFGSVTPDGSTVFNPQASAVIAPEGILFEIRRQDFDCDGQMDVMFITGKFSPRKLVRALVGGGVPLDLKFFRMEGGVYPEKPNATRKIRADSPPWRGRGRFRPTVLIGDMNGDQLSDLLIQKGRKKMLFYAGIKEPGLFARTPQKLPISMPRDEEYSWLVDLNRDGKQDVLMHYASAKKPHRVTLLIAQ